MKAFAQTLDLKDDPELIRSYRAHHEAVWPEVTAALRAIGIETMRIFLVRTRLFMYVEARDDFDPQRDFQNYARDARSAEWDALMRTFQMPLGEEGWWTSMEQVFDLAEQP